MFRRGKIRFIQPFPFLNPACSSLNLLSTALLSLLMIILARILLGMESRVIPRQFLQSFDAPFFGILTMVASFQSSGILLPSQTFIMRGRRISAAKVGFVLKSSALRLSGLRALLSFRALMALIISPLEGGGVSISRSSTATGMSGLVSGDGRFNISLKYSAHRASCVSSDINTFPPLSLIGASKFFSHLPTNLYCDIVQRRLVSFVCCFFRLSRRRFEVFAFVASGQLFYRSVGFFIYLFLLFLESF